MKAPLSWLREYVKVDATAPENHAHYTGAYKDDGSDYDHSCIAS